MVLPDPANWNCWRLEGLYYFRRGSGSFERFVTHATPLSIACDIVRDGIRVGPGRHGGKRVWLCVEGGSVRDRVTDARDRTTSSRCEEFKKFRFPMRWTVPCVLAWEPWPDTTVSHLEQFTDDCYKS